MALDDGKLRLRRERARRYRRLSTLLGEDAATGQLRALAERLEEQLDQLDEATAAAPGRAAEMQVLLAEIDTFLSRAGGDQGGSREACRAAAYSAAGLREASRLCREEAAAADAPGKTALSIRAFDLAQLAERLDRGSRRGP